MTGSASQISRRGLPAAAGIAATTLALPPGRAAGQLGPGRAGAAALRPVHPRRRLR
jgi:hypothetical protein